MKKFKHNICILIALSLLISMFLPMNTMAATTALTATTSTKSQRVYNTSTYYRIACPGEGVITLSGTDTGYGWGDYQVYDAQLRNLEWFYGYGSSFTNPTNTTKLIPVSKGYIYVKATTLDSEGAHGFTYKYTAAKQKLNYSKATAFALAAGKKATFLQTPSFHFKRWIKIKTTKTKKIALYHKGYSPYMFTSRGERINLTSLNNKNGYSIYTTPYLGSGVYYIVLSAYPFDCHRIETLVWK